jgi:uncharacterized membrane protein
MKALFGGALFGCALLVSAGCEQTTTTGPQGGTTARTASPKRLTLTAAKDQTIRRGDTDKILVAINRDNFNDPVTVRVTGLPKGISVLEGNDAVIPGGSNSATVTLKAAADADLGEHNVTLSAEAAGLEKNSQVFRLTVKGE